MLTIAHAPLLPAPGEIDDDAMADDERRGSDEPQDYRVGPPDRRYYQPPPPLPRETNWPAIFACLITLNIALLGYATSILNDIKIDQRDTNRRQIANDATYASEKQRTSEDIKELKSTLSTIVLAFQYNVNGRLNYIEYKTGFKAPPESLRPPQPAQLQGD